MFDIQVDKPNGKTAWGYIRLTGNRISTTKDFGQGILADYDDEGKLVGIEILSPQNFNLDVLDKIVNNLVD